eukprot:1250573-Prymnesium_polylepis.2
MPTGRSGAQAQAPQLPAWGARIGHRTSATYTGAQSVCTDALLAPQTLPATHTHTRTHARTHTHCESSCTRPERLRDCMRRTCRRLSHYARSTNCGDVCMEAPPPSDGVLMQGVSE